MESKTKSVFNIENTLQIEEKLWSVLESLRHSEHKNMDIVEKVISNTDIIFAQLGDMDFQMPQFQDLSKFAENWWETTHEDNLNSIDEVYKKGKAKS